MINFGFQSSKYNNLNLEQELQFSKNNKVDFFDIYFDNYIPSDITNVKLFDVCTVMLPFDFFNLPQDKQQPFYDFINSKQPRIVTVQFSQLTFEMLEHINSKISGTKICIENSFPDCNEFSGDDYINFFLKAKDFATKKKFSIYAAFDSSNAKLSGYNPVEYLKRLINLEIDVISVHFNDNDGHHNKHLPAGSILNGIDFKGILEVLKSTSNEIYGIIEHWDNNDNALEYLRNLAM